MLPFLSPASGQIIILDLYPTSNILHIGIFLQLWDNHTQYFPVDSEVLKIDYSPGKLLPAFLNNVGQENEKMTYSLYNEQIGLYCIQQIAGMIFRRLISNVKPSQYRPQGSKLGRILFGSRVDIYIPIITVPDANNRRLNYKNLLRMGQKIEAGKTIIGFYD